MTTLHYFHYDLCVPGLPVTSSWANHRNCLLDIFSDSHYNNLYIFVASSRPKITPKIGRLGAQKCRKSLPPGVPYVKKLTPWRMYAQFEKLNGSPGWALPKICMYLISRFYSNCKNLMIAKYMFYSIHLTF